MPKKTHLSIFLIVGGVGAGLLVIFTYTTSGGKASITLAFLAAAFICIITGSILAFSQLLDRFASPILDEINHDIEDDIQDLKEHRITNTIWMVLFCGTALLAFSFFVFRFHKVEAMWGSIPVILPTFIGTGALAWFIPRTPWFQGQHDYTPMGIFFIPTAGLILTMMLGINKTENLAALRTPHSEPIVYNSSSLDGLVIEGVGEVGSRIELPNCSGDECGVFLVIALVVLTLILVVGSAMIPHFWLFSGSIFLCIMGLIAIHDLRVCRV